MRKTKEQRAENHFMFGDRKIRAPNQWEAQCVRKLIAEGYEVYRRGWPDYIAVKGDRIRFIEVKPPNGNLGVRQKEIAGILATFGITVEVYNGNGKG